MLALLMMSLAQPAASLAPTPTSNPVRIDLLNLPCRGDGEADVTVCARPRKDYRIDPSILAA